MQIEYAIPVYTLDKELANKIFNVYFKDGDNVKYFNNFYIKFFNPNTEQINNFLSSYFNKSLDNFVYSSSSYKEIFEDLSPIFNIVKNNFNEQDKKFFY